MIIRDPFQDDEWGAPVSRWRNFGFMCLVPFALVVWGIGCFVIMGIGMTRLVLVSAEVAIRKRLTRA